MIRTLLLGIYICTLFQANCQVIDPKKLDSLVMKARATHSDGLYLIQGDKVLVEEYFDTPKTPTYIASVGKALVSIAIIKLLSDGKIKSIDQPVADFYPEWRQGLKKTITLRMILSHTSGLQNERNTRLEIETGPEGEGEDLVQLALAAELTDTPGTVYRYNNKAICLLPGIIAKASGKRMDSYFEEVFFKPMGIIKFRWRKDKAGTPHGHSAFDLLPADLAKFGQLMVNRGVYKSRRYIEERWIDSATVPSQSINPYIGLTWQLSRRKTGLLTIVPFSDEQMQKLKSLDVADSIISKLQPLVNKVYQNKDSVNKDLALRFGANWSAIIRTASAQLPNGVRDFFGNNAIRKEQTIGYSHSGSWGNYLVIVPEAKLVAVRVVKRDNDYQQERDLFGAFTQMVFHLINPSW